jgi:hypothetical protein
MSELLYCLTITKTINRLGTVFFLFVFNIGISIFVFLLTGIMIIPARVKMVLKSFVMARFDIPSNDGIMLKIKLTGRNIITTAFSISTMLYTLSAGYPFFLIAFLQIVTFAESWNVQVSAVDGACERA